MARPGYGARIGPGMMVSSSSNCLLYSPECRKTHLKLLILIHLIVYWAARSSFSYRNTRPSSPAVWSPDGSLIAVAHGPTVTVWDPTGNTLVTSLASVEVESITAVCFLGASGRYLATYSGSRVVLWDLLGGSSGFSSSVLVSSSRTNCLSYLYLSAQSPGTIG